MLHSRTRFRAGIIVLRKLPTWMSALACVLAVACGRGETGDGGGQSAPDRPRAAATPAPRGGDSGVVGAVPASRDPTPVVLFLGNSLTAGFGLDPGRAYPSLVQAKIDSAGLPFRVVNAGVSGATSADGVRQVGGWMDLPVSVVVLELGANDMLRGQDPAATRRNLQAIIDTVRARRPEARLVIAGMRAAPNLGPDYTERFRAIYPELARANGAALVPFLLEGVAADPDLNQEDGMHPNAAGEKIVAANVWEVLEGVLREAAGGRSPAALARPRRPSPALSRPRPAPRTRPPAHRWTPGSLRRPAPAPRGREVPAARDRPGAPGGRSVRPPLAG